MSKPQRSELISDLSPPEAGAHAGISSGDADAQSQASDLQHLAGAIIASAGEDQLAVDILANLAAYPGPEGHLAQQALRRLYEHPGSGHADTDDQIRQSLVRSARAICALSLLTAPEISASAVDLPLSITVAALACSSPVPPEASEVARLARAHIKRQLKGRAPCPLASRVMGERGVNQA